MRNDNKKLPTGKPKGGNLIVKRLGSLVNARNPQNSAQRPSSALSGSRASLLSGAATIGVGQNRRNSAPMAMRAAYGSNVSSTLAGPGSTSTFMSTGSNLPPHHRTGSGRKSAPGSMYGAGLTRLGSIASNPHQRHQTIAARPPAPVSNSALPPHQQMAMNRAQQQASTSSNTRTVYGNGGMELKKTARKASNGSGNFSTDTTLGSNTQRISTLGNVNQRAPPPHLHVLGANRYARAGAPSLSTFPVHQNNSIKRRSSVQDHPRKKRRTDERLSSSYVTASGPDIATSTAGYPRDQLICCISGCQNGVGQKLRFELRLYTDDRFKSNYISSGWNKVCDFHFFHDKMRYKKMNNVNDDKLAIGDAEDEETYRRLMMQNAHQMHSESFDSTGQGRLNTKRKRSSSKYSDDDDQYNSTAGKPSMRLHTGTSGGRQPRSPQKHLLNRLHTRHYLKRASLGKINTNVARRKHFARFETVAVSPEPDASTQRRIRSGDDDDEDDEEMSALNTSSASSSSSSCSSHKLKKQEEESFEMPPQKDSHVLYHQTPITPCDDLFNISSSGGPSTIQKILQSTHRTGLTPRSPGDLPLELISSSGVSADPHFAKLDPAFQGNEEDSRKFFSQYHSSLSQLDSDRNEDDNGYDEINDDDGDSSEFDDMLIVEDHQTSQWRRLDAYSSDDEDNLSTSDRSSTGGGDDEDDSSEIYILNVSVQNEAGEQTPKRQTRSATTQQNKKAGAEGDSKSSTKKSSTTLSRKNKNSNNVTSIVDVAIPRKLQDVGGGQIIANDELVPITRSSSKRAASHAKSLPKSYNSEFTTENLQNTTLTRKRTRSFLYSDSDDDGLDDSEEEDASPFIGEELSDDDDEYFISGDREHRIVDLGMIMG
eukprot:CAMPEP_0117442834 /NCGR_PEP_ID=MMETSP0759-20121206/4366_1 /TAXON_ID=63605 /ORGANISM="Percolomonas cosmopolitus, Strain WS" /LENGTH=878 /DNA_ID=CAMNT_0005234755 /DNA_START=888 /DNA_END=3524 /DNA_ORIENTATION=+